MTGLSWSVLVIGTALTLLLFAFAVRRLIGVRVPALRTLAAGIITVLVFSPVVTAMIGGPGFPGKGSALPACLGEARLLPIFLMRVPLP